MLYGFNPGFPRLFLCTGQIVHALLTRPPLSIFRKIYLVRLACVRHAASVRPEPGSNSRLIFLLKITHSIIFCLSLLLLFCSLIIELRSFVHQFIKLGTHCEWPTINLSLLAVGKIGLGHLQRFLMLFYCLSSVLSFATALVAYHTLLCLSTTNFFFCFFLCRRWWQLC